MRHFFAILSFVVMSAFAQTPDEVFDEFKSLYETFGGSKYMLQESIVQRSHVLQAAHFANMAGAPEEVIVGLLFHDIGQLTDIESAKSIDSLHHDHDELGAIWLKKSEFPTFVWQFVQGHTLAKVILCDRDPSYYQNLSRASQLSYHIQQQKFVVEQPALIQRMLSSPNLDDFLAARKCDDMAKQDNFDSTLDDKEGVLPSLESYRDMVIRVLNNEGQSAKHADWKGRIDAMYQLMLTDKPLFLAKARAAAKVSL